MDYKKKYKQLHNFISDLYPFMPEYCKEKVEGFLPELKESEDEKIRKELLEHCINRRDGKQICVDANDYRRWAAWLENQGKVNDYSLTMENEKIRKAIHIYLDWLDGRNKDYQPKGDYTIKDMIAWLEKQSEQSHWKPTEEQLQTIHAQLNEGAVTYPDDKRVLTTLYEDLMKITTQEEKKNWQKPADKVESKFKVGDWITDGEYIWKVTNIKRLDYILQSQNGDIVDDTISYVDEHFHLWTIQDAKEGDVLVESNCNSIIMFRGVGNIKWDDVIDYHCYYNCHKEDFIVQEGGSHWGNTEDCTLSPATKEQRELLFSKMTEAGYEWDDDKKELKKIEPKSNNVETKFHEGEWVINKHGFSMQIVAVQDSHYVYMYEGKELSATIEQMENSCHLWTIQDAKEGDVLICGNQTVLFKCIEEKQVYCYGYIWRNEYKELIGFQFLNQPNQIYCYTDAIISPATKEQRDTLFAKMKEAGYEWDAEKKELKKIEHDKVEYTKQSYITVNSEFFQWIYDRLKYVYNENPNVDYMISLKERIKDMQKSAWSEEDEKCLSFMIECLETCSMGKQITFLHSTALKYIEWLKSLKDRI